MLFCITVSTVFVFFFPLKICYVSCCSRGALDFLLHFLFSCFYAHISFSHFRFHIFVSTLYFHAFVRVCFSPHVCFHISALICFFTFFVHNSLLSVYVCFFSSFFLSPPGGSGPQQLSNRQHQQDALHAPRPGEVGGFVPPPSETQRKGGPKGVVEISRKMRVEARQGAETAGLARRRPPFRS